MIQRIQTIWLLLTAIFSSSLLIWQTSSISVFLGLANGVMGVAILLSLIAVFLYKNRLLQIKLCMGILLLQITACLVWLIFFLLGDFAFIAVECLPIRKQALACVQLTWFPLVFPLTAIIFTLLARKAIKKDEKLVRSLDRLR